VRADRPLKDPQDLGRGVDRRLLTILGAAARYLPTGWRVELTAGRCPGATLLGPPSAYVGGLAVDVRLIDPDGHAIDAQPRAQRNNAWRAYRDYADLCFYAQRILYPELAGRLAWGGKFTRASGQWQVGRFDLAGFRGRGIYQPPDADTAIARLMREELGHADHDPDQPLPPAA
jgi:hypothetical protein